MKDTCFWNALCHNFCQLVECPKPLEITLKTLLQPWFEFKVHTVRHADIAGLLEGL